LNYDLKNDTEDLTSNNHDGLQFPDLCFFQPKKLFFIKNNVVEIRYLNTYKNDIKNDLAEINEIAMSFNQKTHNDVKIHKRITKRQYLQQLDVILI